MHGIGGRGAGWKDFLRIARLRRVPGKRKTLMRTDSAWPVSPLLYGAGRGALKPFSDLASQAPPDEKPRLIGDFRLLLCLPPGQEMPPPEQQNWPVGNRMAVIK